MVTPESSKTPSVPAFLRKDKDWDAAAPGKAGRGRGRNVVPMTDPAKENARKVADGYFSDQSKKLDAPKAPEDRTPVPVRILPATDNRLLYRFLGDVAAATTAKDLAVKKIRDLRKTAKADGIDLRMADQVIKEMKLSPDELIAAENVLNGYRLALRLPAHAPLELEGAVKRTPEETMKYIELEGERAGLRGASQSDNPHDLDTAAGAAWQEGYDRGQEMLRGTMKRTMERNAAAKKTALQASEEQPTPDKSDVDNDVGASSEPVSSEQE